MNGAATPEEAAPEGFRRVAQVLAQLGHPHAPAFLAVPARTAQEAADALGVQLGQIAKSVVFRRRSDGAAVLVVTSGDRRVDEKKVAAITGPLARADADFVKARTGFSIGGVSPVGHLHPPVALIDRELLRFDVIWAAAGHPNGVFQLHPSQLQALTGAPLADVTPPPAADQVLPVSSPCIDVCRMDDASGLCRGCWRTLDEIAAWSQLGDGAKRDVLVRAAQRRAQYPAPSSPRSE